MKRRAGSGSGNPRTLSLKDQEETHRLKYEKLHFRCLWKLGPSPRGWYKQGRQRRSEKEAESYKYEDLTRSKAQAKEPDEGGDA